MMLIRRGSAFIGSFDCALHGSFRKAAVSLGLQSSAPVSCWRRNNKLTQKVVERQANRGIMLYTSDGGLLHYRSNFRKMICNSELKSIVQPDWYPMRQLLTQSVFENLDTKNDTKKKTLRRLIPGT